VKRGFGTGKVMSCILAVLLLPPAALGSEELKKEFLAAYEPGVQPLLDFYENVRIRFRRTVTVFDKSGKSSISIMENQYLARAPLFRLDTMEEDSSQRSITAAPSGFCYSVYKPPGRNRFQLGWVMTDYDYRMESIRQYSDIPFRLFSTIYNWAISEAVRQPLYRVKAFRYEEAGGEKLARLEFEWLSDGSERSLHGSLVFAPGDCWALREHRIEGNTEGWVAVRRIDYEGKHGRVPLVKRLTSWVEDRDGNQIWTDTSRVLVEVLEIVPGPIPEEEFTLRAFGLTDAGLQATVPPWYYFQLVAVLALLAALVFWRLSKRGRPVAPPPASTGA